MTLDGMLGFAGLVATIITIATGAIAGVVWVVVRRASEATEERKDQAQAQLVNTLEAQRDAYRLERDELAAKVPLLEGKLNALRDEIGSTKAIGEMRQEIAAGFERISTMMAHHEDRAQRADRQQAEWNRAATATLNAMSARLRTIQVPAPGTEHDG